MIDAELKGKIPEVQNREDILTSNYFGLLKYCTMRTFSHVFLSAARNLEGKQFNISCIPDNWDFELVFWPRFHDNSEPDLLVLIKNSSLQIKYLFLIEVKYFSQQNMYSASYEFESHKYENQLSREFFNLFQVKNIGQFEIAKDVKRFLIYLTADYSVPYDDFSSAINEIKRCEKIDLSNYFLWISWYNLYDKLSNHTGILDIKQFELSILSDLSDYLKAKNFWSFTGFSSYSRQCKDFEYLFHPKKITFDWEMKRCNRINSFFSKT
ncbi:MAG: hypothetical protein ACOCQD_04945 [archaeon]